VQQLVRGEQQFAQIHGELVEPLLAAPLARDAQSRTDSRPERGSAVQLEGADLMRRSRKLGLREQAGTDEPCDEHHGCGFPQRLGRRTLASRERCAALRLGLRDHVCRLGGRCIRLLLGLLLGCGVRKSDGVGCGGGVGINIDFGFEYRQA
jgi:hypothetical protein